MRRTAEFRMLVIVFAKAPVPGRVKTRLVPALGAAGAARLHARLARRALATAIAAGCGDVELCCAPHRRHPFFAAAARRFGVRLTAQGSGDIGERMRRAMARGLRDHDAVVLIGSDCPSLRPSHLRSALRTLRTGFDAVFSPAEDGGYGLVGAVRVPRGLFSEVPWGTDAVMSLTRRKLVRLRMSWRELPRIWDVDRPEDVDRLWRSGLLRRTPDGRVLNSLGL